MSTREQRARQDEAEWKLIFLYAAEGFLRGVYRLSASAYVYKNDVFLWEYYAPKWHMNFIGTNCMTQKKSPSRKKINLSLRAHLAFFALIPVCVVIALSIFLSIRFFESSVERSFQEDVELIARAIRSPLVQALNVNDRDLIRETLESTLRIQRVNTLAVYDENGKVVSKVNRGVSGPIIESVSELEEKASAKMGAYEKTPEEEVYSYYTPLEERGGKSSGFLEITRKKSDIDENLESYRRILISVALGLLALISILIFTTHNRSVQTPLDDLRREMNAVRKGDLNRQADPKGPYEISELYSTFNHMVDGLKKAHKEVGVRQENERMLERRLQRVEKLAAVGRLGAGVAHELGTPLSVVDGIAQRALRKAQTPKGSEIFEEIREEVFKMEHIIRQLIDFSRTGVSGKKNIQPVKLGRSIRKSCHSLSQVSEKLQSDVVIEQSGALEVTLFFDPVRLEQVFQNLVKNAMEAAGSGGKVLISAQENENDILIFVDDSGPAVPEELLSKIFEPFFTTKRANEGVGLGLAVVHGIIEEWGGVLEAKKSPVLPGARFQVGLPKTLLKSGEKKEESNDSIG